MAVAELQRFIDTRPFVYTFTEDIHPETKKKVFKVAGLFQKTNEKNENNRIYPDELWERICNDENVQRRIRERAMVGELEHPDDLQTKLPRVSHVITKLEKRGNEIWGEAEILNTPAGLILQELFRAGVKVGTSVWQNGVEIVNNDYILDTFDFVANPATSGAYPKVVSESVQKNNNKGDSMKEIEELQSWLEDIKLIVEKKIVTSKDKYNKQLTSIQKELVKYMDNPETKYLAEELIEEVKELKKKLKDDYEEKYHKCPDECPPECPNYRAKSREREEEEEEEREERAEKDLEECTKCRTKLMLETNYKVYYCGNCQFSIPVSKALTKKTLAEKYVAQVRMNKTFVEQIQSYKESNKILSRRLDNAVKTISSLVNENKRLVVENYVLTLVEKYPILSKYKGQLLQCSTIQCVDKQIELLQPQLKEESRPKVIKTESIDLKEKDDKITSGPSKKMPVVKKEKIVDNKNSFSTTTKPSSRIESIYEKMKLY